MIENSFIALYLIGNLFLSFQLGRTLRVHGLKSKLFIKQLTIVVILQWVFVYLMVYYD